MLIRKPNDRHLTIAQEQEKGKRLAARKKALADLGVELKEAPEDQLTRTHLKRNSTIAAKKGKVTLPTFKSMADKE
jgi:hypothetical protein